MRGVVIHCSRFGAVVRLEDRRLALLRSDEPGMSTVRRAASNGRRPRFTFDVGDASARRVQLSLAADDVVGREKLGTPSDDVVSRAKLGTGSSLEQKIIDYLRQTAEWDPRIGQPPTVRGDERPRADRLLPFESRARRQYRDSPERPRRRKR